jgi:hypothetical protein
VPRSALCPEFDMRRLGCRRAAGERRPSRSDSSAGRKGGEERMWQQSIQVVTRLDVPRKVEVAASGRAVRLVSRKSRRARDRTDGQSKTLFVDQKTGEQVMLPTKTGGFE